MAIPGIWARQLDVLFKISIMGMRNAITSQVLVPRSPRPSLSSRLNTEIGRRDRIATTIRVLQPTQHDAINTPRRPIATVIQTKVHCSFFASEICTYDGLGSAAVELVLLLPFD